VRLDVTVPFGAQLEILGSERAERRGPDAWAVEIGDLVARQDREVVLRVNFPDGRPGDPADVAVAVRDRDGTFAAEGAVARWIYADHATNDRQPRTHDVDRLVARLFAARARMEAVGFNKAGDFRHAMASLQGVASRIRSYAEDDPELLDLVSELEGQAVREVGVAMAPARQKRMYSDAAYLRRTRTSEGKAQRKP
jgi:hypothetical protein